MDSPLPSPWYTTRGGKIFLLILAVMAGIFVSFGALIAYYTVQISQGNEEKIREKLSSEKFSFASSFGKEREVPFDLSRVITEGTPTLGNEEAPLTVVLFIDFECPYCQESYATFQDVRERYEPVVRLVFKHFPLTSIHPLAAAAAEAAECANAQGKFWDYYDILFEKKVFSREALMRYAKETHLSLSTFESCLDSRKAAPRIEEDGLLGISLGVRGTPTYFINGKKKEGVISREEWDTLIVTELEQQ